MWTHDYVGEKLRELDAELARRAPFRPPLDARFDRRPPLPPRLAAQFPRRTPVRPRPMPRPVLGPLARTAGRALHRIGHRLQSWGTPATVEGDAALVVATPGTPSSVLSWWKEGC